MRSDKGSRKNGVKKVRDRRKEARKRKKEKGSRRESKEEGLGRDDGERIQEEGSRKDRRKRKGLGERKRS